MKRPVENCLFVQLGIKIHLLISRDFQNNFETILLRILRYKWNRKASKIDKRESQKGRTLVFKCILCNTCAYNKSKFHDQGETDSDDNYLLVLRPAQFSHHTLDCLICLLIGLCCLPNLMTEFKFHILWKSVSAQKLMNVKVSLLNYNFDVLWGRWFHLVEVRENKLAANQKIFCQNICNSRSKNSKN